jgi:hypothetical protein
VEEKLVILKTAVLPSSEVVTEEEVTTSFPFRNHLAVLGVRGLEDTVHLMVNTSPDARTCELGSSVKVIEYSTCDATNINKP